MVASLNELATNYFSEWCVLISYYMGESACHIATAVPESVKEEPEESCGRESMGKMKWLMMCNCSVALCLGAGKSIISFAILNLMLIWNAITAKIRHCIHIQLNLYICPPPSFL